jgi:DNA-binding NarL/FixJ family response regulator
MDRKSRTAGTAKSRRTRILLVDDHPLVRERLAEIINREADLTVCGEAEDRHEALAAVLAKRPNLVIIDLTLKNSDGMELIKDIRSRWPKLRMLVVSMHDESLYAERVIRAGALGYITKQEATRKILVAIRRVLQGTIYLNEKTASHIISRLTAHAGAVAATPAELLSDRELQVFDLTGRGQNTKEIATRLHLAVKTIETYRARIRGKLKLKNTSELLQSAISWTHQHGTA